MPARKKGIQMPAKMPPNPVAEDLPRSAQADEDRPRTTASRIQSYILRYGYLLRYGLIYSIVLACYCFYKDRFPDWDEPYHLDFIHAIKDLIVQGRFAEIL